jgi:hypothetical protein
LEHWYQKFADIKDWFVGGTWKGWKNITLPREIKENVGTLYEHLLNCTPVDRSIPDDRGWGKKAIMLNNGIIICS